jgi:hypothetical protein
MTRHRLNLFDHDHGHWLTNNTRYRVFEHLLLPVIKLGY